jgi:hypothetical protein
VEQGFLRTAVGQELIDPKPPINLMKWPIGSLRGSVQIVLGAKGNQA